MAQNGVEWFRRQGSLTSKHAEVGVPSLIKPQRRINADYNYALAA